eukprot:767778-Hanusia_phi.AAC.8
MSGLVVHQSHPPPVSDLPGHQRINSGVLVIEQPCHASVWHGKVIHGGLGRQRCSETARYPH